VPPARGFLLAVVFFALGAILLRPVVEPPLRGVVPAPAAA
jgi:hypothetical protein